MYINTVQHDYFVEIHFQSKKHYQSPFYDVALDVVFTTPNQSTIKVPAYWSGQHQWVVRYSSRIPGQHAFVSICSDIENKHLHQITGQIDIEPYLGDNLLLKHGAPIVANDKRHFCHEDGKPFFWLGDTWWMGLCQRLSWPEDFKQLTQDRQQKGFNIVQLVAGFYPDMDAFDPRGISESGFCWEQNFSQINPSFFDEADKRITHLISAGITPCIVGGWGYYLSRLGIEKMKHHWRYLMARWGALPVVWAAAGEQNMPWYLSNKKSEDSTWLQHSWSQVIAYMHEINAFNRMITTHPVKSARASVLDTDSIDFDMQQTDHRASTILQATQAAQGWRTTPTMPVISGESRYEALDILPTVTSKDARQAFWAHTICSGLAGHTYGANGIWQVNTVNKPFGQSPNGHNWGSISWQEAMVLPGSHQLGLAKQLLDTLPWHQLIPKNTFNKMKPKNRLFKKIFKLLNIFKPKQTLVVSAESKDASHAIYYTTHLKKINVHSTKTMTHATWFDPSNGAKFTASSHQNNHMSTSFIPPHKNAAGDKDWLLIIKR